MVRGPRSGALVALVEIGAAIALVGLSVLSPVSSTPLSWSGPAIYSGVAPREVGSGGPAGPLNCTTLHVRFNASGPIDVWVAPGGAESERNGTISFSQVWTSSGPASSGELEVRIPPSVTGYRVVLFNPSWTVTLPSMQFETAPASC